MRLQCPRRDDAGVRCTRYSGHPGVCMCRTTTGHGKSVGHSFGSGTYGGWYRRQQREDAKAKRRADIMARLKSIIKPKQEKPTCPNPSPAVAAVSSLSSKALMVRKSSWSARSLTSKVRTWWNSRSRGMNGTSR